MTADSHQASVLDAPIIREIYVLENLVPMVTKSRRIVLKTV